MGAVCAVVYVMIMIVFIPLPFYEYLVADRIKYGVTTLTVEEVETGRMLHRFPHYKVRLKENRGQWQSLNTQV